MTTSTITSIPSLSSELAQALEALQDLAQEIPLSAEPRLLSAWQQARVILRRHGMLLKASSEGFAAAN